MASKRLGEDQGVKGELPSLEITLEETRRRLEGQFEQIKALDWKASLSLAAGSIVIAILAGSLRSSMAPPIPLEGRLLFSAVLMAIFLSLVLAVFALMVRTYHRPPDPQRLRDYYIVENIELTKLSIIDTSLEQIQRNDKTIGQKIKLVQFSFWILVVGVSLLALWIFLNFVV